MTLIYRFEKFMQKNQKIWFSILMCSLFLAGCFREPAKGIAITSEQVTDFQLPDREIVFQLTSHYSGGPDDRIGFINSDGSGETYIEADGVQAVVKPIWIDDGSMLLFLHPSDSIEGITKEGYRVEFKGNYWMSNVSPIHEKDQVLIESSFDDHKTLKRIDLSSGEVLETYQVANYIYHDLDGISESVEIGTNNLKKQKLVFSSYLWDETFQKYELKIYNTDTMESHSILSYGGDSKSIKQIISPAFSPDGQWIAYTSDDGIYLIHPDGTENHQIIKINPINIGFWPPAASWSPDGQWIVYHRCMLKSKESCRFNVEDSNIFKYNIGTGETEVLVEGGVNPYWRWDE